MIRAPGREPKARLPQRQIDRRLEKMRKVRPPVVVSSAASSDSRKNRGDAEIDPTAARQHGLPDPYVTLTGVVLGEDDTEFSSEKDLPAASDEDGALGAQPVTQRTIQVASCEITIVATVGSTILDVSLAAQDVPLSLEGAGKDTPRLRWRRIAIPCEHDQDQGKKPRRSSRHLEGELYCETDTMLGREEPPRANSRLR